MRMRLGEPTYLAAAILALVVALFVATLSLSPTARFVPLTVLVPTLVLAALQLAFELFPALAARLGIVEQAPLDVGGDRGRQEIALVAWIALLLGLVLLVGLLVALPAFTLLYVRLHARESRTMSLSFALVVLALLYGVFVVGLRMRLFEGFIPSYFAG